MSSSNQVDYQLITPDRHNDVMKHLRNSFYYDEALLKSEKLSRGDRHTSVDLSFTDALDYNISVMAICRETKQICGVLLNGILQDGDIETILESLDRDDHDVYNKILIILTDENHKLNLFQRFNVDRIFENRVLSVDKQWRGRGIGKRLMEKSLGLAREQGFKIAKVDATGLHSINISKSLGYETLAEIRYDEYLGQDGRPIFKVDPPNEKLVILFKRL